MSLGEGFRVRVPVGGGGGFPLENEEKGAEGGEGGEGGGGWGGDRQRNRQVDA